MEPRPGMRQMNWLKYTPFSQPLSSAGLLSTVVWIWNILHRFVSWRLGSQLGSDIIREGTRNPFDGSWRKDCFFGKLGFVLPLPASPLLVFLEMNYFAPPSAPHHADDSGCRPTARKPQTGASKTTVKHSLLLQVVICPCNEKPDLWHLNWKSVNSRRRGGFPWPLSYPSVPLVGGSPAKSMLCQMLSLCNFPPSAVMMSPPCSFLFKVTLTTLGLLCFPVTFRVIFPGVMGNVAGLQKVGSTWSQEWFAISKLIPHDLLLNEANECQINVTEFRTHHIRSAFTVDYEWGCNRRAFCLPRHKMLSSSEYQGKKWWQNNPVLSLQLLLK